MKGRRSGRLGPNLVGFFVFDDEFSSPLSRIPMSDINLGLMVGKALRSDRAVRRTAAIDVVKSTRQVRIQVGCGWSWLAVVVGD